MKKIIRFFSLFLLCLVIAFPLFYMFQLSLFPQNDFIAAKARLFPSRIEYTNYIKALSYRYLPLQAVNSLLTALLSATIKTFVIVMASFAFSHLRFKGKKLFLILLLSTLFIPQDALIFQNYKLIANMGLLDSYLGIIAPTLFSASQMALIIGAFSLFNKDFYDNAQLDGASDSLYITRILMPLTKSFLITIYIQSFIGVFNSYMWPLLVTNKPRTRTLQVGLAMLGFSEDGEVGARMATIALTVFPFVILLAFGKKWIEKALIDSSMHK